MGMNDPERPNSPERDGSRAATALLQVVKSLAVMTATRKGSQALQRRLTDGIVESVMLAAAKRKISENATEVQKRIDDTLAAIDTMAQSARDARQQGTEAIDGLLDDAASLGDVDPAYALDGGARRDAVGERMAMLQIADHLINLVKSEVKNCIDDRTSPMEKHINEMQSKIDGIRNGSDSEINPAHHQNNDKNKKE